MREIPGDLLPLHAIPLEPAQATRMNPTPIPNLIDRINQGTMGSAPAVETYRNYVEITPAERAVFDRVRDLARGRPILDLGVGAGRTVAALR